MKHQSEAGEDLPPSGANKWEVLRELAAGREAFGLTDRDLTVLQVLVSFHQATILGGNESDIVIHPSNRAICERLNGMPCSTMRRHLAHLVLAGVVLRRDSPNGKRYARRYGDEKVAYGFDLSPLVRRLGEFCAAAEAARQAAEQQKRLRETVSLMRRDLAGLAEFGAAMRPDLCLWDELSDLALLTARGLRRRLDMEELGTIEARLKAALQRARDVLEPRETRNMSTNDVQNEQHIQNSKTEPYDSEPRLEKAKGVGGAPVSERGVSSGANESEEAENTSSDTPDEKLPNIPIGLALAACPQIQTYAEDQIRHWYELVRAADTVRPMMGISPSAWEEAKRHMGPEEAAVVVAAMLERFADIHSPGGYLRSLTAKAAEGAFSCGPMVMALMRREAA